MAWQADYFLFGCRSSSRRGQCTHHDVHTLAGLFLFTKPWDGDHARFLCVLWPQRYWRRNGTATQNPARSSQVWCQQQRRDFARGAWQRLVPGKLCNHLRILHQMHTSVGGSMLFLLLTRLVRLRCSGCTVEQGVCLPASNGPHVSARRCSIPARPTPQGVPPRPSPLHLARDGQPKGTGDGLMATRSTHRSSLPRTCLCRPPTRTT